MLQHLWRSSQNTLSAKWHISTDRAIAIDYGKIASGYTFSMTSDEPITPEQERAIELILNAKLETDEDYIALTKLIDNEIADMQDCNLHGKMLGF